MDYWNVLDDDEVVAAAKALRRLLDGGRLGPAEFTLHHSSSLLAIYGDDDHLARWTHLQELSFVHPEAILYWVVADLKGSTTCVG